MPIAKQIYFGLPDGGLAEYRADLDKFLGEVTDDIAPDRIFTMGQGGYDGHGDHILTHYGALKSAGRLRQFGHDVTAYAIAPSHTGELEVAGDRRRKLGAMALHASQIVVPDLEMWGDTDLYTLLIIGPETYELV